MGQDIQEAPDAWDRARHHAPIVSPSAGFPTASAPHWKQDPTPTTSFSTNQGQRKRLAETTIDESMPKRKRNLSTSSPKVTSVNTPSTGCSYIVKSSPVPYRMSSGHFSAWGAEDNKILYYMQKYTNDSQSEDTSFVPTCCQEAPKSSQPFHNSRNINHKKTSSQSNKKLKHQATWTKPNLKSNPKNSFYTHFCGKLVNTSDTNLSKESNNSDKTKPRNSPELWICDTCSLSNKAPAVRCRGCGVLRYGVILQSCKRIQSNEMSNDRKRNTNPCRLESDTVTAPQIPSVTEMSANLATYSSHTNDVICSVPQMYSSADILPISTEERMITELLPTGTERATILQPTKINRAVSLPSVSTRIKPNKKLFHGTLPSAKSTLQDVNKKDNFLDSG